MLCLRVALVIGLAAGTASPKIVRLALAFAGAMVVAGALTPLVGGGVAAVALASSGWSLVTGDPLLFGTIQWHALLAVVATALAMIGPGAYSVDARWFGWRELRVPDRV